MDGVDLNFNKEKSVNGEVLMIGYLKGKVKYLAPDYVLMEVNGVG